MSVRSLRNFRHSFCSLTIIVTRSVSGILEKLPKDYIEVLDVDGRRAQQDEDKGAVVTDLIGDVTDDQVLGDAWKTSYDDVFHLDWIKDIFIHDQMQIFLNSTAEIPDLKECISNFLEASDDLLVNLYMQIMYEVPLPQVKEGRVRTVRHMHVLHALLCSYGHMDLIDGIDVNIGRYFSWAKMSMELDKMPLAHAAKDVLEALKRQRPKEGLSDFLDNVLEDAEIKLYKSTEVSKNYLAVSTVLKFFFADLKDKVREQYVNLHGVDLKLPTMKRRRPDRSEL